MMETTELNTWLQLFENRYQQEVQLGLTRISKVAKHLDLLTPNAKVISVAGTNGKGSTVATLEALYCQSGYQVASYTSPHLLRFNERIRINQQEISDEDLCTAFAIVEIARGDVPLTYFEIITLSALWHFKQKPLDVIILEVGLGGRLDATNIIDADLAIITTIDLDHQEFLGDTKEAIGFEKAGILRAGKPFIYADYNPPNSIVEQGRLLQAPMFCLCTSSKASDSNPRGAQDFCSERSLDPAVDAAGIRPKGYSFELSETSLSLSFQGNNWSFPRPKLHTNSVAAALIATFLMQAYLPMKPISYQTLKTLTLPGRLQRIEGPITTLLDVSHNPQAANYLANYLKNNPTEGRIHAVFSALKDKNLVELVAPLKNFVNNWYPAQLPGKRAASLEQIKNALNLCEVDPICYNNPLSAYKAACNNAKEGDLILVYGSFYTVSEVLEELVLLTSHSIEA